MRKIVIKDEMRSTDGEAVSQRIGEDLRDTTTKGSELQFPGRTMTYSKGPYNGENG